MSKFGKIVSIALLTLFSISMSNHYVETGLVKSSDDENSAILNIIPKPVFAEPTGERFFLLRTTKIYVYPGTAELIDIGRYLADRLNPVTGFEIVVLVSAKPPTNGNIYLTIVNDDLDLGEEGYQLTVTKELITLNAYKPAGLFRGIQTIRQLLPPAIEKPTLQSISWEMATGIIRDYPRFVWRGAMLDVARHFFSVEEIKRFIDKMAYYKMNRFHLHLTDDQGWRIAVNSWPNLAIYGGSTQVGGGSGGFYTQEQYSGIVAYAQARYITVIPEIDLPGHTNAALASYASLNVNNQAPPLYTGIKTGFTSLIINKAITNHFVEDVIKEIAALTPGPYLHIGGDEVSTVPKADYAKFIERVQKIVQFYGKQMIGWDEIATSKLDDSTIVQHWNSATLAAKAVKKAAKIIMSPASKAYLDMKYDERTPLGQKWAGYLSVSKSYNWDPALEVNGVTENDILGVEAPLWTEKIITYKDIEYMVFPRLIGIAEIGWSPAADRNWDDYRRRLGIHGLRLDAMGVNFFRSQEVPWE